MAGITLTKLSDLLDGNGNGLANIGEKIKYTLTVLNTSADPLTGITISDPKLSAGPIAVSGTLAPGASTVVEVDYTLTSADIDSGKVETTTTVFATAGASAASSEPVFDLEPLEQTSDINMTKGLNNNQAYQDANANGRPDAGEITQYNYTVVNNGNTSLFNVTLEDLGLPSNPSDTFVVPLTGLADLDGDGQVDDLAAGTTATGVYQYVLTQETLDNGTFVGTAEAKGNPPGSDDPLPASGSVRVVLPQQPNFVIAKTAGGLRDAADPGEFTDLDGNGTDSGDRVNYSYTFTNTGNVTLKDVKLVDDNGTPGNVSDDVTVVLDKTTLRPGETATGTYQGTLTQAIVDAGTLTNIVTGTASPPRGTLPPKTDTETVIVAGEAAFAIAKTAGTIKDAADVGEFTDLDGNGIDPGDKVNYSYAFTNTGKVTLTDVKLVDDNGTPGDVSDDVTVTLDKTTLLPGETATGTYQGTLKQADIDAGTVTNIVTGTAKPPTGTLPPKTDTETVTIEGEAAFVIAKTAGTIKDAADVGEFTDLDSNGIDPGDKVNYSYAFTNTGKVTLTDVKLVDDNGTPGDVSDDVTVTLDKTTLLPGEVATGTYQGTLKQADIDAGTLTNIVTGTAKPPTGTLPPKTDTETVTIEGEAAFVIAKTAGTIKDAADVGEFTDLDGNGIDPGDKVNYSYAFTNTGKVTLTDVKLVDDNGTPGNTADDVTVALNKTTLLPGEIATGTYQGTLKQADIDAGTLTNIVTGTAKPPTGTLPPKTDTETVTIAPVTPPVSIGLVKTAGTVTDTNHDCFVGAGDEVTYTYRVTNPNSVNLFNLVLRDDNGTPAIPGDDFEVPLTTGLTDLDNDGALDDLIAGGVATGTYVKTLSQANFDAGSFTNIGTVTGNGPQRQPVTASDPETLDLRTVGAAIQLEKEGHLEVGEDCIVNPGDLIRFNFQVTNTGARAFDGVAIADTSLPGLSPIQWQGSTYLNPGQTVAGSATYAITAQDISWGRVVNLARVYGNLVGSDATNLSDDIVDIDDAWVEFPKELIPAEAVSTTGNIVGDLANNRLVGTAGADVIAGGLGDDNVLGGDGDDLLRGDENQSAPTALPGGNDLLDGGAGNDRIAGKGGDDTVLGGSGDDLLWGDLGDDILRGGTGNDRLMGGEGRDTFVLAAGEGFDFAVDFAAGVDRIGLAGLSFGQISLSQFNGDTLIRFGQENLALLNGVSAAALGAGDFVTV